MAAFGAFVDVGVHQDGLVHVSALSKTFVKDPREVVKPGDIVKVKVLDVDIPRKRISLTLRLDDEAAPKGQGGQGQPGGGDSAAAAGRGRLSRLGSRGVGGGGRFPAGGLAPAPANSAMADALRRAGLVDKKRR